MRPPPREEGLRWLRQAEADLRWARHLAEEGGFHIACFLAQQVAEKALKALLYADGEEVVLGYSVERLMRRVEEVHPELRVDEVWAELDGYYVPTRYPNSLPDTIPADVYTGATARRAVALAEGVVTMVRETLSPEKPAEP